MEALSSVKMTVENCLETINVLVLYFLDHGDCLLIIVVHLVYDGHYLQKSSVTSPKNFPFA